MMNKAVAIIGAGRIGRLHAENLRSLGADIRWVCDTDTTSANDLANALSIPKVTEAADLVFQDPSVGAILICSPTDTHAPLIEKAITTQKAVFCEKPIDLDLAKVTRIVDRVLAASILFQVGFNRRFDPDFQAIRSCMKSGRVGHLLSIRITSRDPEPPPIPYVQRSGGIFMDMAIHDFDLARFLVHSDVVSVFATGQAICVPEIGKIGDVDTATTVLTFANGVIGVVENCRKSAYGYDQRIEAHGSEGTVFVPNRRPCGLSVWDRDGMHCDRPYYFFKERYEAAYRHEMRAFLKSYNDGTPPEVGVIDGLKAAQIADAAGRSLATRGVIMLEASP